MIFSLNAPAKINWYLLVINKREDGYHNIVSLMHCIDLFDVLTFEDADTIELHSDLKVPVEDNLVYKAAAVVKNYTSYKRGARIKLEKEIPLTAGLGGGSSDAAYTILGLDRLWKLKLKYEEMMKLAAKIGSDVPFFLNGSLSLVEGRGDKVKQLSLESTIPLLLVKPDIPISASWAYNALVGKLTKRSVDFRIFIQTLEIKDFQSLQYMIFNDLEPQVVREYPAVEEIKTRLSENGALLSSLSGSGPTVFGVFDSEESARKASQNMGDNWCRVVNTLNSFDNW